MFIGEWYDTRQVYVTDGGLYPILYVLENSMREVVRRIMRAQFGDDWWDKHLVCGKLKTIHQTTRAELCPVMLPITHQFT